MALSRQEYWQTMRLTREQVTALRNFQEGYKTYGLDEDSEKLYTAMSAVSSIFGIVAKAANLPYRQVAKRIIDIMALTAYDDRDAIYTALGYGLTALEELESDVVSRPHWQGVEINAPMLEIEQPETGPIKFVQGAITITGWMVNGSWN